MIFSSRDQAKARARAAAPVKADAELVRRQNRGLVLSTLRRLAPIARVDLGTATDLSPATITSITADLMSEGLIEAVTGEAADPADGKASDGKGVVRGRPRVLLRLDADAAYVLSVKIAINTAHLLLCDFAGAEVARRLVRLRTLAETRESFPQTLIRVIRDFLAEEGVGAGRVAEIGVACQGFVDLTRGAVVWSPAFAERNIVLVEPIQMAFGVPCFMTNDANMIAEALNWLDPVRYGGTFAVVFIDYGVGMGLFSEGRLHMGADGSAAEFGHMNHLPNGPLCRCGRRGCVEAFIADYAIYREARGMSPDTDPGDARPDPDELLALERAAAEGDPAIRKVYEDAGTALGYALARVMAIVNPARIIFTGQSTRALPLMEPAMNRAIEAALVADLRHSTVIETLPWQEDMISKGVVVSALARLDRQVFADPGSAMRLLGRSAEAREVAAADSGAT